MKTTESDFDRFKHECIRLQKEWGLLEYALYFSHNTPSDAYATCAVDEEGCTARLSLTEEFTTPDPPMIEMLAKHEMLHLLVSRLEWVGSCRWVNDSEMEAEVERLVVKLEKLLRSCND